MRKILAATLVMMMALMGMMAGSAAAELPVLRVGMECAYAPYNWTQAEPSEYAVPLAAGAGVEPVPCHGTGVFGKHRGVVHFALLQANTVTVLEVDCRNEQHTGI